MAAPKKIEKKKAALTRQGTRLGAFIACVFVSIFWNGIVGVFLWQLTSGKIAGPMAIGMGLFLTPFVLIGLALIFGIGYSFLGLFNPKLELTIDSHELHLGDKISGKWRVGGGAQRIKKLVIVLEGIELATYSQGTSSTTDQSVFFHQVIFETSIPREIERGSFEVKIPETTMHSFEARHNQIRWSLTVNGEIPRWPDVADVFGLHILPLRRDYVFDSDR